MNQIYLKYGYIDLHKNQKLLLNGELFLPAHGTVADLADKNLGRLEQNRPTHLLL